MDQLIAFASAHWVEWLFAVLIAILTWLYKGMAERIKSEQAKNEAIAAGVQSLLREAIVSNYNKYSDKGYCPIYAKESMKRLYAAYHDLAGNDVATALYNKLINMDEDPLEDGDA